MLMFSPVLCVLQTKIYYYEGNTRHSRISEYYYTV